MLDEQVLDRIRGLADEVSLREGCRLYDVQFVVGGGRRILRVYIDKPGDSVGVNDCANVSRGLSLLLDVHDVIPGEGYDLEVSSPGLERLLRTPSHFEQAVGQKIRLKLRRPLGPPEPLQDLIKGREFHWLEGVLSKAGEGRLILRTEMAPDGDWPVDLEDVAQARVVFEFGAKPQPLGRGKKKKR